MGCACWRVQGEVQGPHSVAQMLKWMSFLTDSSSEEHQLAYEQFKSVALYKVRPAEERGESKGSGCSAQGGGGVQADEARLGMPGRVKSAEGHWPEQQRWLLQEGMALRVSLTKLLDSVAKEAA